MAIIHFLNVKEGDRSIIEHKSSRVTVIDVCNAKPVDSAESKLDMAYAKEFTRAVRGNFQQKKYPVNPLAYLQAHAITGIFRYIQTHPDMDHMDGIKALFGELGPVNFWTLPTERSCSRHRGLGHHIAKRIGDSTRICGTRNPRVTPNA